MAKVIKVFPIHYCWTENLTGHPVTEGANTVFYPSYATRWDDNYTTVPLFPQSDEWIPFVKSMPGTKCMWLRGTIYDPNSKWYEAPGLKDPVILAGRDYGKGRVAITGISPFHLFYLTYNKEGKFAEANYVKVDGITMEKGVGERKSDLLNVLNNLYCWLAQPAVEQGMGGYDPEKAVELPSATEYEQGYMIADQWGDEDPAANGPVRPMRILVGARSAVSSGAGSPREWADAAREAGYDVVCFTETLEDVQREDWPAFVQACSAASSEEVALLPGFDMQTDLGARFLIVGHTADLRTHVLTPDGKKLEWTGHMLLGMGDVLPVAARPQAMAGKTGKLGCLPYELYSHVVGVAAATYDEKGALVDDGLEAYKWHVHNATIPAPVAVHEVTAPAQMAAAAQAGLQNYVNSHDPRHCAFYFRQGHAAFGGNPMRYYISEGPLVKRYAIDDWQADPWTVTLTPTENTPLAQVQVYDGRKLFFASRPNTSEPVKWSGTQGVQHWFYTEARDSEGNRVILSPLRTLPKNAIVRCMDRQNWFSNVKRGWSWEVAYTGRRGRFAGYSAPLVMELAGVKLPEAPIPMVQWIYSGQGYTVYDMRYTHTYVPGGRSPGADNSPIFHAVPIKEYELNARYMRLMLGKRCQYRAACEATLTLKTDMQPDGPVWPVLARTTPPKSASREALLRYAYINKQGKRVEKDIANDGWADVPAGAVVGTVQALTPVRVNGKGEIGLPAPEGTAKAGSTYHLAVVPVEGEPDEWLEHFGHSVPSDFVVKITRGIFDGQRFFLEFKADNGGVSGTLARREGSADELPLGGIYPARLRNANPRSPVGVWQKGQGLTPFGFLDGEALLRLNVGHEGDFYAGNLLVASDEQLFLSFAEPWTEEAAVVRVTNPSEKEITATVSTPAVITDRKALNQEVIVPAGASVLVHAP